MCVHKRVVAAAVVEGRAQMVAIISVQFFVFGSAQHTLCTQSSIVAENFAFNMITESTLPASVKEELLHKGSLLDIIEARIICQYCLHREHPVKGKIIAAALLLSCMQLLNGYGVEVSAALQRGVCVERALQQGVTSKELTIITKAGD